MSYRDFLFAKNTFLVITDNDSYVNVRYVHISQYYSASLRELNAE